MVLRMHFGGLFFPLLLCRRIRKLCVVDIDFYAFFYFLVHLMSVKAVSSFRQSACNIYIVKLSESLVCIALFDIIQTVRMNIDRSLTALSASKCFKVIIEHEKHTCIAALPICN